jgi:hypothetical protein
MTFQIINKDIFNLSKTFYGLPSEEQDDKSHFVINGQGTVKFKVNYDEKKKLDIKIEIYAIKEDGQKENEFYFILKDENLEIKKGNESIAATKYINKHDENSNIMFWFSCDKNNKCLKFGEGETLDMWTLLKVNVETDLNNIKYFDININNTNFIVNDKSDIDISSLPIVTDMPPLVIKDDVIDMEDIEGGNVTVISNLPSECQKTYGVVAGVNIKLKPDFINAIRNSLNKPDGVLRKKIIEKAKDKKDCKETYVRVTLGNNMGFSPGIPFVLEIWPKDHYSPIHEHANSYAIIKVLHGKITVNLYPDLNKDYESWYKKAYMTENQVCWMTPGQYQIHQLINESYDFCATLQCYRFSDNDIIHKETFSFIDDDGTKEEFVPESDFTYKELKEELKKEWPNSDL